MKKLFYLAALLFSAMTIASCSDDEINDDNTNSSTTTETRADAAEAEYTICMYATGGGNLDYDIVGELLDNLNDVNATNGKVKFVGLYKPSYKHQAQLGENGGTRYFELTFKKDVSQAKITNDINALVAQYKKEPNNDSIVGLMADKMLVADLNGEKYADDDFQMYDPTNISTALKFLTKKAPAKKYILLTNNHGGGWKFTEDYPLNYRPATRGMVFDDCQPTQQNGISLDQLNAGVSKSGIKFDVLFCDLCVMAHLENLYGYSENFPICIASAESTTSSNFGLLAQRLAKIGSSASHDQLFNECSDWATTTNTKTGYRTWETFAGMKHRNALEFQSMGCYDLTKISALTAPVAQIANWFKSAMKDKDQKNMIQKSVLTTLYTTTPLEHLSESLYRQDILQYVKNAYNNPNMTSDAVAEEIIKGANLGKVLAGCGDSKSVNTYLKEQTYMRFGFPLAYFVWNTARIAKDSNMTQEAEELNQLLRNYTEALKGICQIKCSFDDFPGCTFDGVNYPAMDAYLWTSPTVVLTSLNENGFQFTDRTDYSPWAASGMTLANALTIYHNTKFDQQTNWSGFLQQLDVNPNVVTNVFREVPVFYGKFGKVK